MLHANNRAIRIFMYVCEMSKMENNFTVLSASCINWAQIHYICSWGIVLWCEFELHLIPFLLIYSTHIYDYSLENRIYFTRLPSSILYGAFCFCIFIFAWNAVQFICSYFKCVVSSPVYVVVWKCSSLLLEKWENFTHLANCKLDGECVFLWIIFFAHSVNANTLKMH
jgi:hypothetical protein